MRKITILLSAMLIGRCVFAEIEVINLDKNPSQEVLTNQALFEKEVEKATDLVKPGNMVITIVVRTTNDIYFPEMAKTFRMPALFSREKTYTVQIKPETLRGGQIMMERVAIHELLHIKRGDLEPSFIVLDETEIERNTEYQVYQLVGWDRYTEYLKSDYASTPLEKRPGTEGYYVEAMRRWIGISKEVKPANTFDTHLP